MRTILIGQKRRDLGRAEFVPLRKSGGSGLREMNSGSQMAPVVERIVDRRMGVDDTSADTTSGEN